ncbi:MAG: hypothetical protein KAJ49_01855 [Arcobacteraceae bacterium]|nr:hypothetical protein [Arcobacteraceae bacterium]
MNKRLLVFAHDANSANITIAYIYFYKALYNEVILYPSGPAINLYNQKYPQLISYDNNFNFNSNDTIVTGTSGINSSYEMSIIQKAIQNKVKKTIVLVDNNVNFETRFELNNKILPIDYKPNEIWVDADNFHSDIKYLNDVIFLKDNFYIKYLKEYFQDNPPIPSHDFIKKYKYKYITILTEYLYELYHLKFGFTEYEMLEYILKNIPNNNIPIFIKLHPTEHKNKFNIIIRKYSNLNIVLADCNIHDLIYHSKIIFGINSSLFKECNIFKIPTYSVQINSNKTMVVNFLEKAYIIYNQQTLKIILKKQLS